MKEIKNAGFPLRKKLILFFTIFFFFIVASSIYVTIGYRTSSRYFQGILDENQQLEKLSESLQSLEYYSEVYLSSGREQALTNYYSKFKEVNQIKKQINEEASENTYQDLGSIISSILAQAQKTVNSRQNQQDTYYQQHLKLQKDIRVCQQYIVKLINQNNRTGNQRFSLSQKYLKNIEQKAIILAALSGGLSILFVLYFSINITRPLEKIMKNARLISRGNFDVEPIEVKTNDELKAIARVFNQMTRDINNLFSELQEKIRLERELQQEKMENLKMNNLLREAEIKKLQAQVNPHFLYNTLNTISQVAILEEADQTGQLIKKIARLLRYNLKQSDTLVPVAQEIEHIELYCHIMEVRYGDKVTCELDYEPHLEDYYIPCMTIQPLVENAFIHGIDRLEDRQGKIHISLKKQQQFLKIVVEDNGQGMSKHRLKEIMKATETPVSGLLNIKQRLELYFKREDLFFIESKPGQGTKITIEIPPLKGGN